MDTVRLVFGVDVNGCVRSGIADFQGQPHLFLSECLDRDDERRRRRLGDTFFLLPVSGEAAEEIIRACAPIDTPGHDPEWRQKHARRVARWVAFQESAVQAAEWAWRARGNFRAVAQSRDHSVPFRWVLLPGGRVSGDALRARLAHLEELQSADSGHEPEAGTGEEVPF